MASSSRAVVGLQWGDEGKGKLVDWLARDARHVARYQGGHNAGHTVIANGSKIVLHLIPSGIMQPHCHCYIGQGVVLSIGALLEELGTLQEVGIDVDGRLSISPQCSLILGHHVRLDEAREKTAGIGTTKRGIGPAHEDKIGRRALKLHHVLADDFAMRLEKSVAHANCELVHLHGEQPVDLAELADELLAQRDRIAPFVADVPAILRRAYADDERILIEGSQGALLDIEQGSYPFVTSATCLATSCAPGLGAQLSPAVLGITKSYTTRVGGGSFPTEIDGETAELLTSLGDEFGATTARQRRVGWLDIPALRHALALNSCSQIALTKLDILGQLDSISICTRYRDKDGNDAQWVADDDCLANLQPEYIKMPGWGEIGKPGTLADLPEGCRAYIEKIESLTQSKVAIISYGQDRDDTLALVDEFA